MSNEQYGPAGKPETISYTTAVITTGTIATLVSTTGSFATANVSTMNMTGAVNMTGIQSINTGTAAATTSRLFYSGTSDGTLFLPNIATAGQSHEIVVRAGNRFVLYPCGTQTISGGASVSLAAKDSLLFHSNGIDWYILSWYRVP